MADGRPLEPGHRNSGPSPQTPESGPGSGRLRRRIPAEIRDVSFPVSVRGYDRQRVDAYVIRVNRVLAELEATRSPEAAVRHALEQVGEQARAIVEQARESAEEITLNARREAEESTARAKAEAADIVVTASAEADRARAEADEILARSNAEAEKTAEQSHREAAERLQRAEEEITGLREEAEGWARELRTDTDTVWQERRGLLDDIRELAARLEGAVRAAEARPRDTADATGEGKLEPEPEGKPEASAVAADDPSGRGENSLD